MQDFRSFSESCAGDLFPNRMPLKGRQPFRITDTKARQGLARRGGLLVGLAPVVPVMQRVYILAS
jgi:hypothetical protein